MKTLINWIKRMITLIQGITSTPTDDIRRQEIPSRLAIEKGIQPDEAITVSQIAGGDGIFVKQSDGYDDNYNLDLKARGNLVINREILKLELTITPSILPYIRIDISKESMEMKYGKLIPKSILIVNGVEYAYKDWFIIDMYNIGGFDQYAIEWLGNDMFELEADDSAMLRI